MNASFPGSRLKESKHDAFLRLAEKRVERALNDMRLVSQLSSRTYENTNEEAEIVVSHLIEGVREVAQSFDVPFSAVAGESAQIAEQTNHLITNTVEKGPIDEMEIISAIEFLADDDRESALSVLKTVLAQAQA